MTTEHKHTPGPWRVERAQCGKGYTRGVDSIEVHGQGYVARVGPLGADDLDRASANATLIARAPDLLAENERLRGECERLTKERDYARRGRDSMLDERDDWKQLANEREDVASIAALNAELLSALREIGSLPDVRADECSHIARAIIAKTEGK